jgi:HEAT repeat protein
MWVSTRAHRRAAIDPDQQARADRDRASRSWPELPGAGALAGAPEAPAAGGGTPVQSEAERAGHVASLIGGWRTAILQRDADTVVQLDLTFRETPDRYVAALLESARTDANERVRAFSTRTLGKLGRADLAPAFGQLLADASPYVRENAAWALGELASEPQGREAARATLAELRRAEARDPVHEVRSAARNALTRLE